MNNNQNVGNNQPINQTNTNQFNGQYQSNQTQYNSGEYQNQVTQPNQTQFGGQYQPNQTQYNSGQYQNQVTQTNQTQFGGQYQPNQTQYNSGQYQNQMTQTNQVQFGSQYQNQNINQPIQQANQVTQNNAINTNEDEILLESFVGENYSKIRYNKFNIGALFAAPLYFFYRKMIIYGILFLILHTAISSIINNEYSSIFLFAIAAVTVNKIYINFAEKKIAKIKEKNKDKTLNELKVICAKKGGTSIPLIFLGIFIVFIIGFITVIITLLGTLAGTLL